MGTDMMKPGAVECTREGCLCEDRIGVGTKSCGKSAGPKPWMDHIHKGQVNVFSACPRFNGKPLKYLRAGQMQTVGSNDIRFVVFRDHLQNHMNWIVVPWERRPLRKWLHVQVIGDGTTECYR